MENRMVKEVLNLPIDTELNITNVGTNTLIHSDFYDVLPYVKSKSIDVIFADLPYNTTKCKWDTPLDLPRMWEQYKRVIKDRGVILLFAQTPFDKTLGASNIKWMKYEWIWEKSQATGFFNAKKMPMKAHENILVFYKRTPKFYPQKTEGHKPVNSYTKRMEVFNKTEVYGKSTKDVSGGGDTDRYQRSVLRYPSDKQKKGALPMHPTQKPFALVEEILRSYTDPTSEIPPMILDNCMGANTTGEVCQKLGYPYLGIEKELKWFDVSTQRIIISKHL
jgi:DNA modification methylase